jgi:hypothetical protein
MMSVVFLAAFVMLALVGLTQMLRGKNNAPRIGFTAFWLALLTSIIAVLSIGILQTHLGCLSLWGDCYSHNYPFWLRDWKPLIIWSPLIWCLFAFVAAFTNIVVFVRGRTLK